jgi:hypothetical protein
LPRDLAYPELLPADLRKDGRFLYPRESTPLHALRQAIEAVRRQEWVPEREAIAQHSDAFHWSVIAPRFDAAIEATIAG